MSEGTDSNALGVSQAQGLGNRAGVPAASSAIDRFYADHYAHLDSPDKSLEQRVSFSTRVLSGVATAGPLRLLEVGCGTGTNLLRIGKALGMEHVQLLGIDVSESAVRDSCRRGVKAIRLDLNTEKLPYDSESIDCVLFMEVIEHLYYSDLIMDGIARVLRRNGVLIITTPNLASWANRMALLLGFQPFSLEVSFLGGFGQVTKPSALNGHIKSFTMRALKEYVRAFGFTIIAEGATPAGGVTGLVAFVDRLFSWMPSLASHTMLAAQRK